MEARLNGSGSGGGSGNDEGVVDVSARYEKGTMMLTSNRGFAEGGELFGDPVVASLLNRLMHHAVVAGGQRSVAESTP